jgi:hypothetical protein
MSKQDRVYTRTASDLERKYNFGTKFAEILGVATDAQEAADRANDAADRAQNAVDNLNDDLDQEEIFNRLTNNSADQGIYRENGKIYVNASFIKTGFISSDLIKAGVIRSLDYKSEPIEENYPSASLFPGVSLYPNNGESITQGIEIDFESGVIRGVFFSDVTNELADRITKLEQAVFN